MGAGRVVLYSSAAKAETEVMVVRTMLPLAVSRQRQKQTGVLSTTVFAAAPAVLVVVVRGMESSIMSSLLNLVNSGEKRVSTGFCFLGPSVCHWACGGVGPEEAAEAKEWRMGEVGVAGIGVAGGGGAAL